MALEPGYQFVVDNLVSLAVWEDKSRSLVFCLVRVVASLNLSTLTTNSRSGLLGVMGEQPFAPFSHLLCALRTLGPKNASVSQFRTTPRASWKH